MPLFQPVIIHIKYLLGRIKSLFLGFQLEAYKMLINFKFGALIFSHLKPVLCQIFFMGRLTQDVQTYIENLGHDCAANTVIGK